MAEFTTEFPFFTEGLSAPVAVTGTTWSDDPTTPVAGTAQVRLEEPNAPAGQYIFGFAATVDVAGTGTNAEVRFSLDGGVNWHPEDYAVAAITLGNPNMFMGHSFPKSHAGGALDIVLQFKRSGTNDVMNVSFADITFTRVA